MTKRKLFRLSEKSPSAVGAAAAVDTTTTVLQSGEVFCNVPKQQQQQQLGDIFPFPQFITALEALITPADICSTKGMEEEEVSSNNLELSCFLVHAWS